MFRIFTRKAVKAVPRPTTRLVHNIGHPYTGPASYDTIMRRLNSDIDPQSFSIRKRQQERKARGEFIDIHDIGTERFYFDASFPDVNHETLFPDIDHETLNTKIAEELGIPYLSKASEGEAKKMVSVAHAYIHGQNCRTIVPFIVSCDNEARWVFFIVDNVCPLTYFSAQTSKALGFTGKRSRAGIKIGGYPSLANVASENSHIRDVNILGIDFCAPYGLYKVEDYKKRQAKLYFLGHGRLAQEEPDLQ